VNNNSPNLFQVNLPPAQSWLTIVAICLLLGSLGLGWIVKSALIVVGLLVITPIVGFLGFFWWLRRSIVQAQCPVCTNCGEVLKVDRGQLVRDTPPDTIDVVAVEVMQD
jgi:hypothetical protein